MRIYIRLFVAMSIAFVFTSCKDEVGILYDVPFEQMVADSKKTGRHFCIVISRSNCPPCVDYVENLDNPEVKRMFGDATINIVDASLPENVWYTHWLCMGAFPTTCVFSPDGKLKAVVSGINGSVVKCIKSVIDGQVKCAEYLYQKHYTFKGDNITLLNNLLECKRRFDNGEDICDALDGVLEQTDYPYPVFLKALNADKHGRRNEAVRFAEKLLTSDNTYYYYVYDEIFKQAKYIVNPDYMPQQDELVVPEEIELDSCKVGEPMLATVNVKNIGEYPIFIRDIKTSCTCLELKSSTRHRLEPNQSVDIELEFTAENQGEVYREVTFFSNSSEPVKRVALRARVS